jgi:hypothetical protein
VAEDLYTDEERRQVVDHAGRTFILACVGAGMTPEDASKALLYFAAGTCLGVGVARVDVDQAISDTYAGIAASVVQGMRDADAGVVPP